ncbi:MAG: indolepyruvate/phenylpyruvate decarboxylase [Alphaproteobacteria bacterium]|nr:indolepyruvate/phenylpyruvate decarboxylase [Alphaproteobacteria bacterium]
MNLAESLLHALKDHGAQELFGIPGDFALPFFKVIEETKILPYYTMSHEPGVGFAADAAVRWNSGLGVAVVTYGAGAFNMVNAVAGAYAEKSPLVVISGAPGAAEARRGLLLHHQAKTLDSQIRVYQEITCDQVILDNAERAPQDIARVLRRCREQARPVYIEFPRDMVDQPCAPVVRDRPRPVDPDAVAACADEILARLKEADSPVLMAGVEIRRYGLEDKVEDLAKRLGLPVATSFMGRGLLADADVPFIGTYIGLAGNPEISQKVETSDALLLLGVILCDTNFGVSERNIDMRYAIQVIDREVRLGHHVYQDIPLGALIDALLERAGPAGDTKRMPPPIEYPRGLEADEEAISPTDLARAVNDLFDAHGTMPIASDIGDCLFTAMDIQLTPLTGPGYYAGMGYGVPAGLGLQATSGERPIILVGDGAFQMTGWELGNCRRYGWDPIVLLFNNASWEMLRAFQPEAGYNDLDDWRFADMAAALGGVGHRVATRSQLKAALDAAHAERGRFQLIEVMIPRGVISRTLDRFVKAYAAKRGKG